MSRNLDIFTFLVFLLCCGIWSACSVADTQQEEEQPGFSQQEQLNMQRTRWGQQKPSNYEFTFQRICYCGDLYVKPARILVRADTLHSLTYIASGEAVPLEYQYAFPIIDSLFSEIEQAIKFKADSLYVDYDESFGIPTAVYIDYRYQMADDELSLVVTAFKDQDSRRER